MDRSEYMGACLGEPIRSETGEKADVDEEGAFSFACAQGSGFCIEYGV